MSVSTHVHVLRVDLEEKDALLDYVRWQIGVRLHDDHPVCHARVRHVCDRVVSNGELVYGSRMLPRSKDT